MEDEEKVKEFVRSILKNEYVNIEMGDVKVIVWLWGYDAGKNEFYGTIIRREL